MKKKYNHFKVLSGLAFTLFLLLPFRGLNAQDIIGHPEDVTIFGGFTGSVYFEVDVNPDAKVTYQWYFKEPGASTGKAITGETGPILEVLFKNPVDPLKWNGVGYYCVVTGDLKEVSLHAYLWVQPEPKVRVITGHPQNVTKFSGYTGEINYNVEITPGVEAKIYWYKRAPGTTVDWQEAGTGPQLTEKYENLDSRLNGTAYRCLVVHADGQEYSQVAYLWVKRPKKLIRTEPVDVYKPEGFTGYINFDITPGDYIGITFQWQIKFPGKTWSDLTGAEKPVLEYPIKEPLGFELDGTAFRCIARYSDVTEVSERAYLHVEEVNKYILLDPEDVMKKQGWTGELYFYIKYDDQYELAFQWQEKKPGGSWVDITHVPAYKPELYYPIKDPLTIDWNGWGFRCVAINRLSGDVEYSAEANLYVSLYDTYFLGHPRNTTICEGAEGSVGFKVKVVEEVDLSLQWQMSPPEDKSWYDIPGADSMVYIKEFTSVPLSYNGTAYRCQATDQYGGTEFSDIAFLYVTALPRITTHPQSQEKMVGEAVTFNVLASGAKPFYYQWYKDDAPLPGATASSLSLFPLAETDSGDYHVIVTNVCPNSGDTSDVATLTVNAPEFGDGWFEQDIVTSKDLTDIKFTGTNSGWVTVSNSNFIYKTVDGGKNWSQESVATSMNWEAVFTTDANHVWIAGEDSIKYTVTGGGTWNGAAMNGVVSSINLFDLYFTDNSNGWAVGDNGLVLHTSDGGANWSEQHSGSKAGFVTDVNLSAVHFFNADTGWAVGDLGAIMVTHDGGSTWVLQTSGVSDKKFLDLHFISKTSGWVVGSDSIMLSTSNGGETWIPVSSHYGFYGLGDLTGVHFYDTDHGWIISSTGLILRTNDGGLTWYDQNSGITQVLNAIDFADYDNGWVVGNNGTILRTAYGGCLLPRVSLFEDKEFCASVDYTLVADSFASNIDCSYEWNTGETTGSIVADTSDKYYVTVTSVCGETVSDTVNILLYPLPEPDAGSDQEICGGDSVQLLATGGVDYSWNNEAMLDDPGIQNPKAGPPVGSTDFIVTVTDENLCQNTDTVNVTVYSIPTSTFTSPAAICYGDSAAIIYEGSASADANFYWDFDEGSTIISGDSIGPYGLIWDAYGDYTIELVVEENGCSSDTGRSELTVHPIPISEFSMPDRICGDDPVDIVYSGTDSLDATYDWLFDGGTVSSGSDEGPYQVSWATEGTKSVSLQVTQNGCESDVTMHQVVVAYPYEGTGICVVTIDSLTEKNLIVWERPLNEGIASFNIYRQSAVQGIYDSIGNVPFEQLSVFVDSTSEPRKKEHWYKISAVDTCGNESSLSPYHKTVFLQYDEDDGDLNWARYEIEGGDIGFTSYIIYRGLDSLQLDSIDVVAGNASVYTDTDNPTTLRWYRIAGTPVDCSPTGTIGGKKAGTGPYSHSLSNLDNNKLQSGTGTGADLATGIHLEVYPNPFQEKVRVDYRLQEPTDVRIEVFNILGVRILELENGDQAPGVYHYDIMADELDRSSVYYLRFTVNGMTAVKKLIPAR